MESLAQHIVAARLENRKTLRGLAGEVGVSPTLLSFIEHGRQQPSKELVVKLATLLGADPDEWCGLLGKITPQAEKSLARLAREDPAFFRNMVNRLRR